MRKWSGLPGTFYVELEIAYRSSGYYDPGVTSALPENCYPPEGEEERVLDSITTTDGKVLPKELAEALFEFLRPDVEADELEYDDD